MPGFTVPPSPPSPLTQALLQWMALIAQTAAPTAGGSPASMDPMPDGMNGMMRGPGTGTSDSILARLSNGEYVLPKSTVDQVGPQNLDALRQATQPQQPQTPPRFALGGLTPYGNDSSITDQYQRASAIYNGPPATQPTVPTAAPSAAPSALPTPTAYTTARSSADSLDVASGRFDRNYTPPPTAPNTMPQNGLSGLLGAMGQQQQQQDSYSGARSSADPLDVASGRFDRQYAVPRFAEGGYLDPRDFLQQQPPTIIKGTPWDSSEPVIPTAAQQQAGQQVAEALNRPIQWPNSASLPTPVAPVKGPANMAAVPLPMTPAPVAPVVPVTPAPVAPAPVVPAPVAPAASLTGAGPRIDNLPDWGNRIPTITGLTSTPPPTGPSVPIATTTPGPGAGGLNRLDNTAENMALPAMYTSGSTPIGTRSFSSSLPFEPSQTGYPAVPAPNSMAGDRRLMGPSATTSAMQVVGSSEPLYATRYVDVNGNSATITGPDQRVGGGTLSAPDQGNGGTVAGNVAAINSQIAALQSLREARNPGITTGNAGRAFGDLVSFGAPGGRVGDEAMAANRAQSMINSAASDRHLTHAQRSAMLQVGQMGLQQVQAMNAPSVTTLPPMNGASTVTPALQAAIYEASLKDRQANATLAQQKEIADRNYGLDAKKADDAKTQQDWATRMAYFKSLPVNERETRLNQVGAMYQAAMLDKNKGPNHPVTKNLAQLYAALSKEHYDPWAAAMMPAAPTQ